MDNMEFTTGVFLNTDEQASEISTYRRQYLGLLKKLGELGTEVRVKRTIESDRDVAPYSFVRAATHEFIFPPQQVTVSDDNSRVIDPTSGYGLRREDVTRAYDEAQVTGRLEVRYDDSEGSITFCVTDLSSESDLSEDVLAALAQAELSKSTHTS